MSVLRRSNINSEDLGNRNIPPAVSVIITSYNQARTLKLLFASLDRQTDPDFEVVVADDGSSDETSLLCAKKHDYPICFVTQPDIGYRKAKILNEAIRHARASYLIFVDGDVILGRHFIEDHLSLRKPNHFVCGRRVDLGPKISETLEEKDVLQGSFDFPGFRMVLSHLKKDTLNLKRGFRLPSERIRSLLKYNRPLDILGSNLGVWAKDIWEVNGFNETLESYWGEDGDLYIRLRNSGKQAIGAKGLCIQYHVFHPRRELSEENLKKYQQLLKNTEYKWAVSGLSPNNSSDIQKDGSP